MREEYGVVGGYIVRMERYRRVASRAFSRADVLLAWVAGLAAGVASMALTR